MLKLKAILTFLFLLICIPKTSMIMYPILEEGKSLKTKEEYQAIVLHKQFGG